MLYDFLQLDRSTSVPLWSQLYEGIKQAIETGYLAAGEKLTSIRQASAELGISRTTVETAYVRLTMEGYVESKPQSGYHVRTLLPKLSHTVPAPIWIPRYDFGTAAMDLNTADLDNWKKLVRAVLSDGRSVSSYGNPQGEPALREQLAGYAFRSRGVLAEEKNIFIGAGVGPLLQLLCPLFEEKPPVVMEGPGFLQAEQIFRDYGFQVSVPSFEESENPCASLPQAPSVIYAELPSLRPKITPSSASAHRITLAQWAEQAKGRYILEDDYNGELHYKTRPVPAFQGACPHKTIYLGSFSKLLVPSVRIAYMVLPPELAEKAQKRVRSLNQTAGKTEQLALAEYIRTGLLEKHLRRLRRTNNQKSQLLVNTLQECFGENAICTLYETHLFVVLSLHCRADSRKLCTLAKQAGINCRPASSSSPDSPRFIIGFSGIDTEKIAPGIRLLKKVWEGFI